MKDPREVVVRNLFTLRALENTLGDAAEILLVGLADEIVALIAKIDPTGARIPRYRKDRANRLLTLIDTRVGPAYEELHTAIRAALVDVGREQARRAGSQLISVLGRSAKVDAVALSANRVKALIDTNPIQGALLKDWFKDQADRTAFRVRQQINLGVLNGETIGDIVRRVRGRADGPPIRDENGRITGYKFTGGVMETSTREATAIVRTAVNHISNEAQRYVQEQNADIAPTYTIVATLDSRTSPVCQARDGETHPVDDPNAPRPPFHVACRTITVPNVDWASLGLKPPEEGTRASAGGQVPSSTTYSDWLRDQPAATQDEILGPARARLFRDGKVSLRDLIRSDGRRIRLSELAPA